MGRSKKYISPSKKYRSILRLAMFLRRRLNLHLEPSLAICHQTSVTIPPFLRILSSKMVSRLDIPPIDNPSLDQWKRPKPKFSVEITSNTCDTPACHPRRRPCHALNPPCQDYLDWVLWFWSPRRKYQRSTPLFIVVSYNCVPLFELFT